ncbi:uncharacterized protein prr33 isoform 1-T2 [Odontesthes bonariensis]|uniref:uncharacterized protein prr33 n=1 Tax=Odontesthes bonariensis TaxID=219752 RepID=UPI003F585765
MAAVYGTVTQLGLLSQQYPPPLLPKPGKDNVRLQKLLKRTAKKKASTPASQSATPFRSSLSPVNEASPDLEHSDHSTPPKTPETLPSLYSIQQPPRFTVRPLYQHVASPYPQRAAYGRATRLSPQTVAIPSYSYLQHVTTTSSHSVSADIFEVLPSIGQVTQPAVEKTHQPSSSAPKVTHDGLRFATTIETQHSEPKSPGQTPHPVPVSKAVIRPLIVLTPLVKSKSPRPTFKATEPSKSPRPMFDVPKIRMYTASTSYYETSRTPPVYDTAALAAIGSTVPQSKTSVEPKQEWTPTSEVRRGTVTATQLPSLGTDPHRKTSTTESKRETLTGEIRRATPTAEIKRATPTSEIKRATPTAEIKRATPTSEIKRATPTAEIKRATPTSEIKRATPTAEIKRATPTSEIKRATPTAEIKRATPTAEINRVTPTSEIKRATPASGIKRATPTAEINRVTPTSEIKRATTTSEIKRATPTAEDRVKTPTYEFQNSRPLAGRLKTPAYHMTRTTTPVFEISRPNPLLFAVSPITVETERSKTPLTISTESSSSTSQKVKMTEVPEILLNGDTHSDITPNVKSIEQSKTKLKSEPDLIRGMSPAEPISSQRSETTTSVPSTPAVIGYQRPKTPTYEASRLMTISPGYKRPKTPTYGISASGASHGTSQRPKTPVSQKSKSAYRGLTPAEYAAYGGIKTFSPAFGISSLMMPTQEEFKAEKEVPEETGQQPSEKEQSTVEVSKEKETSKDVDKLHKGHEKLASVPSIPIIVVSQASGSSGTMLTQETSPVPGPVAPNKNTTAIQQTSKSPIAEGKLSEKQEVTTPIQETKSKTKVPETKHPLPKGGDQDPLKAVKKLLGKTKVQTTEEKAINVKKADASVQKEPLTPASVTSIKPEGSKLGTEAPTQPVKLSAAESGTRDKEKDKKPETASADKSPILPEKKEAEENLLTAEPLLKVMQKSKGNKSRLSGWSRLKKHMVVEQEEPQFPEVGSQKEVCRQDQGETKTIQEKPEDKPIVQDDNQIKDPPRATKMWDAVLFQMFSSKENILHQIELNKSEEKEDEKKDEQNEIPSFAYRLPVLLFSPKFDAKRLKEAASRPVTKISTVFEMGLIGRKGKDEEPKDFNRTARGFIAI